MGYCFKNLVFEGGGVKGIAYAGAIRILEEKGIMEQIERVAGTSAGAITAVLVALRFTANEIHKILTDTDFRKFKDDSIFIPTNFIRFFKKFGWYKGKVFLRWMEEIVRRKHPQGLTFGQLASLAKEKKACYLYVVGADLAVRKKVIFSHETFPDMNIVEALRVSMSIPLVFKAVRSDHHTYIDGGIYYNYPITLFDQEGYNKETLGMRVDTTEELAVEGHYGKASPVKIEKFKDYMEALIGGLADHANKRHLSPHDWHRTIYIDCECVSSTDFNVAEEEKQTLLANGAQGARDYFVWYDLARGKWKPMNK